MTASTTAPAPFELVEPNAADAIVAASPVPRERAEQLYHHIRDAKPEDGIRKLHELLMGALKGDELVLLKQLLGLDPAPLQVTTEAERPARKAVAASKA